MYTMNFNSPEWAELKGEIGRRITELDLKNRAQHNEVETSRIRGQIAALQALLDMEANAAIPIEPETFPPP